MRVLCIWIPDLPLQRLAIERADLHGRTVVLYEASPQRGLKVVAATAALGVEEANFIAGIYPGMPLAEATALAAAHSVGNALRGVPEAPKGIALPSSGAGTAQRPFPTEPHLEPADFEADRLALEQLAEWCGRFSPIGGVEDAPRPDCLLLDVTGMASLFGGECALTEEVVRAFAERGLNVRVALADTIGAAWAAVHSELCEVEPNNFSVAQAFTPGAAEPDGGNAPLGAKAPAKNQNGDSNPGVNAWAREKNLEGHAWLVAILRPGETLSALAPLPIGYLRVAEETAGLLTTLGITRIGQLAALPRSALLARFGPELLRRFDQAIGGAPEMIAARHAPPEYAAEVTFEAPLANREAIEHVLGKLIAQVTEPLVRRRKGVLRLVCRLKYERAFEDPDIRPFSLAQAFTPGMEFINFNKHAPLGAKAPAIKNGHAAPGVNAWATEKTSSFTFSLSLFRPSASPEYLRDLLRLRLENMCLAGPVTSVHVEATSIGPLELRQQAMFDHETNQDQPRRLAELVDRLSNRLGRGAVAQVALLPDAQPEYTCVDVPLTGVGTSVGNALRGVPEARSGMAKSIRPTERRRGRSLQSAKKKNLAQVSRYGLLSFATDERPLWLLPQPARIEVVAIAASGAPGQFRWAGRNYSIAYAWGPERIETGWWRTSTTSGRQKHENRRTFVRRDYYRVETTSGARFWIFRNLADRQWFLQGQFD